MSSDLVAASTDNLAPTVIAPTAGDARSSASVRTPMQSLTNRSRWVWARLQEVIGSFLPVGALFPVAATVSGNAFTVAGHGLIANDAVRFFSVGGSVPAPLVSAVTYYVKVVTTDTLTVSATPGGTVITLTNTGSGSIYGAKVPNTSIFFTIAGYVGASFTLAAGSIQTALNFLADNAALYNAAAPHFTNSGDATFDGNLVCGATLQVAGVIDCANITAAGDIDTDADLIVVGTSSLTGITTFGSTVILPTSSAPADGSVPSGKLAIYYDGTNLKAKTAANVVKTFTWT